ncbi:MAG: hypothetical protein MUF53_11620, partial [Gemmatimonadaceae bacterium]|nr:hypothetical protein [Gemmatimonadaceae bacterium]
EDAVRAIRAWHEALVPGGRLNVIVPDLEFHCRQWLGMSRSTFPDQRQHALAGFFGWRVSDRGGAREDAHRWGYDFAMLASVLRQAGFVDIERVTSGEDSEPWHLNVVARKAMAA